MRVIGFVPARSGSKSIKDKNLALVGGELLINRAIKTGINNSNIDYVVFSSDSQVYCDIALEFSADILIHNRPPELSSDRSRIEDAVKHFIEHSPIDISDDDVMMLIEPTSPFILQSHVDGLVDIFFKYPSINAAQTVSKYFATDNPDARMVASKDGYLKRMVEHRLKQDKSSYFKFGNLCAARVGHLSEGNKFLGSGNAFLEIEKIYSVNIDSSLELLIAQVLEPYVKK